MLTNHGRRCLAAAVVLALAGCSANPPYSFAKDEQTASIRLFNMSRAAMCKGGKFYNLSPEEGDSVRIPAGQRITVGSFMSFAEYRVSYTCYPFLSFVPRPGEKYVLHNGIRDNKCFLEVVREDLGKPAGVSFEPSIGPRDCYAQKSNEKPAE